MTADNFCFYLQKRLIQISQTEGQQCSDTSPFSVPWCQLHLNPIARKLVFDITIRYHPGLILAHKGRSLPVEWSGVPARFRKRR